VWWSATSGYGYGRYGGREGRQACGRCSVHGYPAGSGTVPIGEPSLRKSNASASATSCKPPTCTLLLTCERLLLRRCRRRCIRPDHDAVEFNHSKITVPLQREDAAQLVAVRAQPIQRLHIRRRALIERPHGELGPQRDPAHCGARARRSSRGPARRNRCGPGSRCCAAAGRTRPSSRPHPTRS
jgi:hypothetical protein